MVIDVNNATSDELDGQIAAMLVNRSGFAVARTDAGWRLSAGEVVIHARRSTRRLDDDNPDEPTLELVRVLESLDLSTEAATRRAMELLEGRPGGAHQARLTLADIGGGGAHVALAVTLHLADLQEGEVTAALGSLALGRPGG